MSHLFYYQKNVYIFCKKQRERYFVVCWNERKIKIHKNNIIFFFINWQTNWLSSFKLVLRASWKLIREFYRMLHFLFIVYLDALNSNHTGLGGPLGICKFSFRDSLNVYKYGLWSIYLGLVRSILKTDHSPHHLGHHQLPWTRAQRCNSWTEFLVQYFEHKLKSSRVFIWFSTLVFPFYQMLFVKRLEFSCSADFFVMIFKPK
jgi:hypothetical protein